MSKTNTTLSRLQDQIIDALLRAFSPARRACARAERLLSLNADGQASQTESLELAAHLERCAGCRALENATLLVRADLRERPRAVLPDALAARLSAAIDDEQRRERVEALERQTQRRAAVPRLRLAGGIATAAGCVALLSFVFLGHAPQPIASVQPIPAPISVGTNSNSSSPGTTLHPTSGKPATGMSDTGVRQAVATAANTPIRSHHASPISASEPALVRALELPHSARPEIVAVLPKSDTSFFPRERTVEPATAARPKPLRSGIGLSGHARSPLSGAQIASSDLHSDQGAQYNGGAPDNSAQMPAQVVAARPGNDQIASASQASMQNNLSGLLRSVARSTQDKPRETITLTSLSSHPSSYSDSVSIVGSSASL